ncbi:Conserved TM helix [Crenothrix polyspora]|uniref:Small-conductance mechanosensitive channel n=1 Tax=Crenothrix polyspora TaxID=360316 RepID=A0A1R4H2H5_9GAMM|nr:mechanosensitive ion channel [Crenothrix polyspora]SJM90423.1 Conserved TM helix [Crenothrix polyspora]
MNETISNITRSLPKGLGDLLPSILLSVGIFIIGWIIASIASSLARKALGALNKTGDTSSGLGNVISKGVFWIILFFTVIIALNNLNAGQSSGPLNAILTQTGNYLPKLISAGVLAVIAWLVATVARIVTTKALSATSLDSKLFDQPGKPRLIKPGADKSSLSVSIGNLLFSFILLLFIPGILGALQMDGLLLPIQGMVQKMLGALPNIFGAGIIGAVGWFIAKILRNISMTVLNTAGADKWGAKLGLQSDTSLASMGGLVVFLMVFIPALIAALNTLGIDAISRPATDMLQKIMTMIPNLFAAAALLGITYFVGKFAASSVSLLLKGMGFDGLPAKLGCTLSSECTAPSDLVSKGILFFMMLFATVEAANMLGFHQISDVVTMFIQFGGQVLLGAVIFAVGFWIANLAKTAMLASSPDNVGAANLVRFTIIGLVTAMGLRAMGLADDIVNLAFGLTLGAVAVAFALSFGLGGREAAGKQMDYWLSNLRK